LIIYHASFIEHWNNRIIGNILGLNIGEAYPEGYATGRVDLWSISEQKWFTKYMGIGPSGEYGVDFSDLVQISEADFARVWITLPDGNQQAALAWGLHIGASLSDDEVWGYTRAETDVTIELYARLVDGKPEEFIAYQTTMSDSSGFFSTKIQKDGKDLDLAPSNVIVVRAGLHQQTMSLYLGKINLDFNIEEDQITIEGSSNALMHLEGRRMGVLREDGPYQDEYVWKEFSLDEQGKATLNLSDFDIKTGDLFDLTWYFVEHGWAVHTSVAAGSESGLIIYLPLVLR